MNVKKFLAAAFTVGILSVSAASFANDSFDGSVDTEDAIEMDSFGHGGGHGGGHHGGRYLCYARNARGMQFTGQARDAGRAQKRAVDNCYSAGSRFCYAQGCNYVH